MGFCILDLESLQCHLHSWQSHRNPGYQEYSGLVKKMAAHEKNGSWFTSSVILRRQEKSLMAQSGLDCVTLGGRTRCSSILLD